MLKFVLIVAIVLAGYYYLILLGQVLGIIQIIGEDKLTWKTLIPFYQFYKLFKN